MVRNLNFDDRAMRVISDFYAMGAVWFDTTPLTQHGQNAYRHTLINYSVYGSTWIDVY